MTPDQEEQFSKYGCACRCLLALSNIKGPAKTKAEFIDEFSPSYPQWTERCGVTDIAMLIDIARKLGLGANYTILLGQPEVRKSINEKRAAFVLFLSEKTMQKDGTFTPFYHCSLVGNPLPEDGTWPIAQVDKDINIKEPQFLSQDAVVQLVGYFLLIS